MTLSRVLNHHSNSTGTGTGTGTDIVDRLCTSFECSVEEFLELAPE
jgi:DNA-binding Xre family transcriptional regulator